MNIKQQARRCWRILAMGFGLVGLCVGVSASSNYLTPPWRVDTFAGYTGTGSADGAAAIATFNEPSGVAFDGAGNLYIVDTLNSTVRKLTPDGQVSTLAGIPGVGGIRDGAGEAALFNLPFGLAAAADGTLYVADTQNHLIRQISPTGMVSTLAGSVEQPRSADGTGSAARFNLPTTLTLDATDGVLYIADTGNHTIRKLVIATGVVTTLAGTPVATGATRNGIGAAALFNQPVGLVLSTDRAKLYVAEATGQTIRQVVVSTRAVTTLAGVAGTAGSADGIGSAARFDQPKGLAVDGAGNLYVAEANGCRLRRIQLSNSRVVTLAGSYLAAASEDGLGVAARFNQPAGLAYEASGGRLVVADALNAQLRSINLGTTAVTTLAGPAVSRGTVDATGDAARFNAPHQLARDAAGNLYVADSDNHTLRKITPAGVVTTLAGLAGVPGSMDGTGAGARFNHPVGVAVTSNGATIYVSEDAGQVIRKVTATGVVTTLAGTAGASGATDGAGAEARFNGPAGLALDAQGNLYVADYYNHTIRKITPSGGVTTFAGTAGAVGSTDGTGTTARFRNPVGLAFDASGRLYVADYTNQTIRRITASGTVSTFAGAALLSGSVDADIPTAARFFYPSALAIDGAGRVYVADYGKHTIRRIDETGKVRTMAGTVGRGGGLDGLASTAQFRSPRGIAVSADGSAVYVADKGNNAIRELTLAPVPELTSAVMVTGTVDEVFSGYTITATRSPLQYGATGLPQGLVVDPETGVISGKPTKAGTFAAVVSAENIAGTGTQPVTFTIKKGAATIQLDNLDQPYDGTAKAVTVTTTLAAIPVALTTVVTYNGSTQPPTAYGTYALVVTIDDANYQGTATGTFQISAPVAWTISTLPITGLVGPKGLAMATDGTLYIADAGRHVIYKWTTGGGLTVLAGGLDDSGYADGNGGLARFNMPSGLALDGAGNLYVADTGNHRIRKITPSGTVSLVAGDGSGTAFLYPQGVALMSADTLIVADSGHAAVRKITLSTGVVSTFYTFENGDSQPAGLAIANNGTLLVSDAELSIITTITSGGSASILAGSIFANDGSADGVGAAASFSSPQALALDAAGNLFVADTNNHTLRRVTAAGEVTTLAGLAGTADIADGLGSAARFSGPSGLAFAADGTLYIADTENGLIRRATPPLSAPVLAPLPTVTITEGMVLSDYAFSASGSPTVYAASGLPPGLNINSTTGAVVGTPEQSGIYSVSLSVTNALTTITSSFELTVNAPTWEAWQTARFTTEQLADALVAGESADPDGDGVPNLFEYLQGSDPLVSDVESSPVSVTDGRVTLVYEQLRAAPGWSITAEYSTDLQTWHRGSGYIETVSTEIVNAHKKRVTVRAAAPVQSDPRQFLRLVAETESPLD